MNSKSRDYSIFDKFNFERKPVGVKFLFNKPEGFERLDKNLAFCEMIKEAQMGEKPFYVGPENQACKPGAYVWGVDSPKAFESGLFGVALKVFKETRADVKIHQHVRRLEKGIVNYIGFSPLDRLPFDPDLLIVLTDNVSQSEIILRAMTYSTGQMYESRGTLVGNCASLYIYPYLSGKVNYMVTGLSYGMKGRRVFPEGLMLISIPYQWIPTITQNLKEMKWVPPGYEIGSREEFVERDAEITKETAAESENP